MVWMVRHFAWRLNRLQIKSDGRTAYRNLRDQDYDKRLVQFGEFCQLRNDDADQEFRRNTGVFAGKNEKPDELITTWITDGASGETTLWHRLLEQRPKDLYLPRCVLRALKFQTWSASDLNHLILACLSCLFVLLWFFSAAASSDVCNETVTSLVQSGKDWVGVMGHVVNGGVWPDVKVRVPQQLALAPH